METVEPRPLSRNLVPAVLSVSAAGTAVLPWSRVTWPSGAVTEYTPWGAVAAVVVATVALLVCLRRDRPTAAGLLAAGTFALVAAVSLTFPGDVTSRGASIADGCDTTWVTLGASALSAALLLWPAVQARLLRLNVRWTRL